MSVKLRPMKSRVKGFTLLEVLIALAVFAIVGAALVKNASQTVKQTAARRAHRCDGYGESAKRNSCAAN